MTNNNSEEFDKKKVYQQYIWDTYNISINNYTLILIQIILWNILIT